MKTCFIYELGNSSGKCKVLGDFGAKYVKVKPTKENGNHSIPSKKFKRHMEKNIYINDVVDDIILYETQKVSAAREATEVLDSDCDENYLYQVDKMILENIKEKL